MVANANANVAPKLSSSDALMWRIETDPVLRSPVVVVGWLDEVPDHDGVMANFARAVGLIPRLRQRIVSGFAGAMHWEDDPDFSLDHHVHFRHTRPNGRLRDVLDIAEADATTAFDMARPPWACTVLAGLHEKHAAFVFKFHHSMTDGVGGVEWASLLFDHDDTDAVAAVVPPKPPVAAAHRVGNPVHQVADLISSVGRMLAPVAAPLSPVLTGRSLDRRMETIDVPLSELRRAAAALEVTLNEAFLAGVAGGLRAYHVHLGAPVPALRFTMPISLREEGDASGGNRFAPARFVMPIDDPDVHARAQIARGIVRQERGEPALKLTDIIAALLARLPTPMVTRVFGDMLRNIDVDVVDVPGLTKPAYLGGASVSAMYAFAPPTGAALSITLLSHLDTCCVAVLCDTKPVSDPALLRKCLADAFDEVVACGAPA
ncbi:MAG TPA: wax ester/triacylglycerol synthase domain-containing protein [Acidimicrobiales bacterium]|nr:wax ester/triacylglycerol synthase domain-containing protein [Acidimicrobiales bacterium]